MLKSKWMIEFENGTTIRCRDEEETREPMRGGDYSFLTNSSYPTRCPNCDLPYWEIYPYSTTIGTCKCRFPPGTKPKQPKEVKPQQLGWECPVCGCGNAPWASGCRHCKKKEKEIW